jgi:hypothetical protein
MNNCHVLSRFCRAFVPFCHSEGIFLSRFCHSEGILALLFEQNATKIFLLNDKKRDKNATKGERQK